jgi:NADP-dependent 3-hydroxy acid dehydrogenase YdfG
MCAAELTASANGASGSIDVLEMEVTDDESVLTAVNAALAGVGYLDVVVNNAGISSLGLTEAFTPADFARVFDVNVNGVVRVNRAVLPSMRARGSGLLVHVSSAAGRATVPGAAPYCASKYALEALADAYRYELHPWGIQSILVEPGIYRTAIIDNALTASDAARLANYGPRASYADTVKAVFAAAMADPGNPGAADVGDAIVCLVEMDPGERPFRTVVSPPLLPMLGPYNDMAESHRAIVAGIFGVPHLAGAVSTS